ncbi:MAG: hypothetical protein Fur006_34880 [Coleofasciculaceae cyanobacterium]
MSQLSSNRKPLWRRIFPKRRPYPKPKEQALYSCWQQVASLLRIPVIRVLVAFFTTFFILSAIYGLELASGDKKPCESGEVVFLCRIRNSAFLGLIESFSIVTVAILFILETPDRKRQKLYQLWNLLDGAGDIETSYARTKALEELNQERESLEGLDAEGADLAKIELEGANLQDASLQRVKLNQANLKRANLQGAKLQRANLEGTQLQDAFLWHANLQRANLQRTNLERAKLGGADLQKAVLHKAILCEANLQGADLREADLRGADLQGVILEKANLAGANLRGVQNLKCSEFEGATNWQKAICDKNFCPDLIREETAIGGEALEETKVAKNREDLQRNELLALLSKLQKVENLTELIEDNTLDILQDESLRKLINASANWLENNEDIEETQSAKIRENLANLEDAYERKKKAIELKKADQEAAEWLAEKKELLKSIGGDAALTKNPEIRTPGSSTYSPDKIEQFYQDIDSFLTLIGYYLSKGKNPQPIFEGTIKPVLDIPIYLDAFRFIVEQAIPDIRSQEPDKLSSAGLSRLNFYLNDCLIKGLEQSDFSKA